MLPRPVRALLLGTALLLVVAVEGSYGSTSGRVATVGCGSMRVSLRPDSSSGAMNIKATRIPCRGARRVVGMCLRGRVPTGWTVVNAQQTLMTKDAQRITYTPVGGGGCGAFTKPCADFFYRGVGFFGMHVLGPTCSTGRAVARSWYTSAGRCSFRQACTVRRYHCVPNARRATVVCRRPENGYRIDWQMGE